MKRPLFSGAPPITTTGLGVGQAAAPLALAERGARQHRGGMTGRDLRSSAPAIM
jgi:hypothetical protein